MRRFVVFEGQSVLNGFVDDRLQLPVCQSGAEFKAIQVFSPALTELAWSLDRLTGCTGTLCNCDCKTFEHSSLKCGRCYLLAMTSATSVILLMFDQLQS